MSFGLTAATWAAIGTTVAAVGVADSVYNGVKSSEAQKASMQQAQQAAQTTATQADEANNAANAKAPNTAAQMAAAILAGKAGNSSTLLTGGSGVDPTSLTLGKSSLLGS